MGDCGNTEFTREVEVESSKNVLKLNQYSVGDVGCVVWDAGIVMGKYLDHNFTDGLQGKTVIDIGSGTGIAGLYAAALGAEVILTDLPEIIPLLEGNIKRNSKALQGTASAAVLNWGEKSTNFPVPDLILVSDCIYYDLSVEKLIPTLSELAGPQTEILISYEERNSEKKIELFNNFFAAFKKIFHIEVIEKSEQHPEFQSPDINLLKCKKKSADQDP